MSAIKQCFNSRWKDEGYIVQTDFSQLEVIGVAYLSQDPNLYEDILSGTCMHCVGATILCGDSYETVYEGYKANNPYYVKHRKNAKTLNFLIQYGGGAYTLSKGTGLNVETCKDYIDNYYRRYSQLKQWQDDNIESVRASRWDTGTHTPNGYPIGAGEMVSLTGRRYRFTEEEAPSWMKERMTFKPTKIKNYPSQGFATGDIVPMCLGHLHYELKADKDLKDKALLINTIHDSVMLDVHESVLEKAVQVSESVLSSAPQLLKQWFQIDFDLPLKVDSEFGRTWGDMEPYTT